MIQMWLSLAALFSAIVFGIYWALRERRRERDLLRSFTPPLGFRMYPLPPPPPARGARPSLASPAPSEPSRLELVAADLTGSYTPMPETPSFEGGGGGSFGGAGASGSWDSGSSSSSCDTGGSSDSGSCSSDP